MKTTFFDSYNAGWHYSHAADLAPTVESHQSLREVLAEAWQRLLKFFTNPGNEPHIWASHAIAGEPRWNAYDPMTGKHLYAATKNEVLVWLEQRYNYQ